jgi:hypothetical protein
VNVPLLRAAIFKNLAVSFFNRRAPTTSIPYRVVQFWPTQHLKIEPSAHQRLVDAHLYYSKTLETNDDQKKA